MNLFDESNKNKKISDEKVLKENHLNPELIDYNINKKDNILVESLSSLKSEEVKDIKEEVTINNPRHKINNKSIEYIEDDDYSDKAWSITLILCIVLGFIGLHRFYVGKAGTAILMLFTLGGFGIWVIVDLITIIINNFTDEEGKIVKRGSLAN